MYNRDVVLPTDNLLKSRRKYHGEAMHKIALEQQHKSFMQVHRYLKKAKRRQAKYADKNGKNIEFAVGDPVYLKNHIRKSKLDRRWNPYWRIIKKTSPITFVIRNQLDGKTTKTHAEHLRILRTGIFPLIQKANPKEGQPMLYLLTNLIQMIVVLMIQYL